MHMNAFEMAEYLSGPKNLIKASEYLEHLAGEYYWLFLSRVYDNINDFTTDIYKNSGETYSFAECSIQKFIKERIPQIKPVESDATYLMWLDCTDIASDSDELKDFICERSGLYVSSGSAYRSNGGFLRFNIACPQKMLEDGLKRLEKSVKEWKCS